MKAEYHEIAEAADQTAAMARADGMRSVLDHAQAVLARERIQRVLVHRQPRKMHRHDGARPRSYRGAHEVDIEVAGIQVDVDEHRSGAHPRDHIGTCGKAHGGYDDFVTLTNAGHFERHFQPGRCGRHDAYVARPAQVSLQRGLEGLHLRAACQLPRAKYLADSRNAVRIDRRPGKR